MQLTLFVSIALLCSSVLAAPPQRRDNTMTGIDVQNVTVGNLTVIVNILKKKDASIDLGILRARSDSSDGTLIGIDIGKRHSHKTSVIFNRSPQVFSGVLNNTTVEVASP
ncbi:hypothetical protein AZE42_10355 [Rhizopogon vesiculosus]|uniref:Uncharacterized protein n=1 Tax=Rhizopogon vesiculosus TaxID=180088 RepID=A0A1J8QT86_9AGAM|nr:hypothetical protein AZE42_10355 [Rhizopogon vesiculosus]